MVKMAKQFLSDYLNFTRKERAGIIIVLILIILCLLLPFFYSWFSKKQNYDHNKFEKEIEALNIKQVSNDSANKYSNRNFDENNYQNYYQPSERNYYSKQPKGELFYFDPNTLSVQGWVKLGVREKTANSIQKYVSKGGKFYKPEDIGKIWGLHEDEVQRLLPYVRIESIVRKEFEKTNNPDNYKTYEKPKSTIAAVDINEADTTAFIALPGIGSKLANRIVSFREKLGGFYSIEQVGETYALPDSTFQKIKNKLLLNNVTVKKININTASIEELKSHPYLRYNLANAIIQYRSQHGTFNSVGDIRKIMIITDDIYTKASPYLSVQ